MENVIIFIIYTFNLNSNISSLLPAKITGTSRHNTFYRNKTDNNLTTA